MGVGRFEYCGLLALLVLSSAGPTSAHPAGMHAGGPPVEAGARFSGQWYNPDQPGHGLLLEVLPGGRAFGAWFVFDDSGNPFWVVGLGDISGHTMRLDVQSVAGGLFPPNFDPDAVRFTGWGRLTIHFEGCARATLEWASELPAFGAGSMTMQRLTSIDGLPCGETDRWLADLEAMADAVTTLHPDPFHMLPPDSFEARMAALRQRMPGIVAEQVPVAFAELLAGLGDAHTGIYLPAAGMRRFPIELSRVREGLIVSAAHDGFENLLGQRLIAIDGVSVEIIETSLARVISHDNHPWVEAVAPEYMMIPEVLAYLGHIGSADSARFRFQHLGGDITDMDIPSMPAGEQLSWHSVFGMPEYTAPMHRARNDNYWFEYIEGTRTMYLAYHRAQEMHGMPFSDLMDQMERFAQRHPVDRVIVDLRFNRGGNSAIMQPMIEGVPNSPFNDPERLFVLIGRNTFSSGLINAFQFTQMTNATLVGRPTGGKPDHFGEVGAIRLNETGLRVGYSTRRFELVGDDTVASLQPDIRVDDPTWREFLEGRDPDVAAAGGM